MKKTIYILAVIITILGCKKTEINNETNLTNQFILSENELLNIAETMPTKSILFFTTLIIF